MTILQIVFYVLVGGGLLMLAGKLEENQSYQSKNAWYKNIAAFILAFAVSVVFPVFVLAAYYFGHFFYGGLTFIDRIIFLIAELAGIVCCISIGIRAYYGVCNKTKAGRIGGYLLFAFEALLCLLSALSLAMVGDFIRFGCWTFAIALGLVAVIKHKNSTIVKQAELVSLEEGNNW